MDKQKSFDNIIKASYPILSVTGLMLMTAIIFDTFNYQDGDFAEPVRCGTLSERETAHALLRYREIYLPEFQERLLGKGGH